MKKTILFALFTVLGTLSFSPAGFAANPQVLGEYMAVKGGCPGDFEACEFLTIQYGVGRSLRIIFGNERHSEYQVTLERIPGTDEYEFDEDFAEGCEYLGCAQLLNISGTLQVIDSEPVLTATFKAEFLATGDQNTPDGVVETTIEFVKSGE